MKSKKIRRRSGRKYPRCNIPQRILDEEGLVIESYWDDWCDWRDGMRDRFYLIWKKRNKQKKPWRKRKHENK